MDMSDIIGLLTCIFTAIFGTGGLCAFIITLVKISKKSSSYEVRCRLASEMLKRKVVEMKTPEQTQLFIDILDGNLEETPKKKNKIANDIIKEAAKQFKIIK